MAFYMLKVALSALLIVLVSEAGKRSATFAALIASLPIISLASFLWMHAEAVPDARIADVANDIFWLALPFVLGFLALYMIYTIFEVVSILSQTKEKT